MNRPISTLARILVLTMAALASSCAGTRDVDVTPTARVRLDAHLGTTMNSDSTRIDNIADTFNANQPVLAVVDVTGDQGGMLRTKWIYEDGTTVLESSVPIVAGQRNYSFRMMPEKPGEYRLEVYAENSLEDTERFRVR